jgi:putative chitinase
MSKALFNRDVFFNVVRGTLFHGSFTQQQVDGMDAILDAWEDNPRSDNLKHLSYPLATTAHETGFTMAPIEEYGKGQGMDYGAADPETGQTYYGRGYVQLTWRDNYARADEELNIGPEDSLEWHAERALDHYVAAEIMFQGMEEGWFRGDDKGRQTLDRYFSDTKDDSYGAREIINGDKSKVPSWSGGVSIGNLIKGYHIQFLAALEAAAAAVSAPAPETEGEEIYVKNIIITSRAPIQIVIEEE